MPDQALQRLLDGNRRFIENKLTLDVSEIKRRQVAKKQEPFAAILGCVDSRVPPELIFDQGLGELLVIRTAGEVLDHAVLGSLEFGVAQLGIPIIVVLGHKNCGALKTATEVLHDHRKAAGDIEYLVEELEDAVEIGDEETGDHLDKAVRAQIFRDVIKLRSEPVLAPALEAGKLKIVGAWYDLEEGNVEVITEEEAESEK